MSVVYTKTGGWNSDAEDRAELAKTASPKLWTGPVDALPLETFRAGWSYDEDQTNQGSCAGQANSTCSEIIRVIDGGDLVQLSRQCAYIMAQKVDGIRGDRGSTIHGGIKVGMEQGLCLESIWPYPNGYDANVPSGYAGAVKYLYEGHVEMRKYQDCWEHLATAGPLYIGIVWSEALDRIVSNNNALVKDFPTTTRGGGHSITGVDIRLHDFNGNRLPGDEPWILYENSWSTRWGYKGQMLISPQAQQQMLDVSGNVVEGLYGCKAPPIEYQGGN